MSLRSWQMFRQLRFLEQMEFLVDLIFSENLCMGVFDEQKLKSAIRISIHVREVGHSENSTIHM